MDINERRVFNRCVVDAATKIITTNDSSTDIIKEVYDKMNCPKSFELFNNCVLVKIQKFYADSVG